MSAIEPGTRCMFHARHGSPGSRVMNHTGEEVVVEREFKFGNGDYVVHCVAHGVKLFPFERELTPIKPKEEA
jgi:hypothetical protein